MGSDTNSRAKPDLSILRDDVLAVSAYHVPPAEGLIKLDAMENPYRLPAALARTLGERLAQVALNRYPPANPAAFKAKLARAIDLPAGMALMLGNGSDELIHLVIQACAKPGAVVLSPWPSFVMYEMSAKFDGCRFVGVPLRADFSLDGDALLAAIARERPAVIFIAWPNNPTGNLFDRSAVEAILDAAPGLVVLDEAYLPFARDTWLPQLADGAKPRPNLLVLRTLSKLGLAGIRLGYLAGDSAWIGQFDKLRPPYNVNVLTLATADLLLDHLDVLDAQAAEVRAERARLLAALRALPGVTAFDSAANFILFRVADPDGVFAGLKARGILIKNVARMHPLLAGCLRTTVGTPQENDAFLDALKASL
ncbi:MAG: histidinol-phosphate aminotransferase [Betaproteobacteria bacterium]